MQILFYILLAATPQWELNTSISYVYNIQSDGSDGVWCASSGGVFHYSEESGIGTIFSCPGDLPIPDCRDILLDSGNRLWVATEGKYLVMKDGDVWTNYSSFNGVPGQGRVNALAESGGYIWIGCDGGFARGDENGFVPIPGSVFSPDDVYSISERNDTLWLCTSRGIYSLPSTYTPFSPASWTHWPETQGLQLTRVRVGEHSIYACGGSGAVELSPGGGSFQFIIDYTSVSDSAIVDVMETSHGLLAAGHGVVYSRNGSNWSEFGSGLPSARWPTVLFELNSGIFSGFSYVDNIIDLNNSQTGLGFYHLQEGSWEHIPIPGIQCKKTHQMVSCEDGRVYVGTYARGVQAYFPGYGWRSYVEEDGMPNSSQTFTVAADPTGNVWASSYHHGLSCIMDNGTYESQGDTILTFVKDTLEWHSQEATIIYEDHIPNNQPVMMSSQGSGMWAAFCQYDPAGHPEESSGILGFNGDPLGTMNWAPRISHDGIASVNVRAVYPASEDSLWIAFKTGAGCQLLVHSGNPADPSRDFWYPASGQAYTTSSGLPSSEVFCFLNVQGIGLLAGTGEGLALWTGSGFAPYMSITGQIKSMSMDLRGRIWCLGASGIYRIADGEVDMFTGYNSDYVPSDLYSWEYSTRDEVNGGVFLSSEKGLWLVTQDGGVSPAGSGVSFYPQPFISGEDQLRLCGPDDDIPVAVDFFRLDGSHAGTVEALSVSSWIWDGFLDGDIVAGGVYMVLVTVNNTVYQGRISVVR
ncbi:MAG: hypothetical protein KAR40_03795 [Candidatus Sabulitectum sp.]|nr:hypothetical protein [Candidatus Sabulitectum sp.]